MEDTERIKDATAEVAVGAVKVMVVAVKGKKRRQAMGTGHHKGTEIIRL